MRELFKGKKIVLSVEIFPPKIDSNVENTLDSARRIWELGPDYISITRGAGGSSAGMDSVAIADKMKNEYGINTLAHLTCINSDKNNIDILLDRLERAGIKSILALRGDLTPDTQDKKRDFHYATDLIEYIGRRGGFDVCAACYPEGHSESHSFEQDLRVMKAKAEAGITHFITQLFYDNNDFFALLEQMYKLGITTPVQAGIMPLTNTNILNRIVRLSGAKIPNKLAKMISRYQDDADSLFAAGIEYAIEQIDGLLASGARGIHLYAMNNVKLAGAIASNIYPKAREINGEKA
ncbi:MAG: methylenetetrahydrofolate reductase [Christensenellales bacterium]|jgi:methylenetetrahydrofolate reductase (NADPH)